MRYIFSMMVLGIMTSIKMGAAQTLPIKPSRTISFTTDEGSYMNVDVSPDGRTILFDLLGDLYTIPSNGGNATQITRGMAIYTSPIWSPDGTKIACISDYSGALHLNIMDINGHAHTVLGNSDPQLRLDLLSPPAWTADGHYISIGDSIYGTAGGKLSLPQNLKQILSFSVDGEFCYYLDSSKVFRYNYAQKSSNPLLPVPLIFQSATISPDSHWCAYVKDIKSKKSLVIHDLINDSERILVPNLLTKYPDYKLFILRSHYSFSPDSKSLYIGYGGKIHRIEVENGADHIIPFTVTVKVDAGPLNYNRYSLSHDFLNVRYTRSANPSPDGKHLVFSALSKIYTMDLTNGKTRPLTNQSINQFQPIYSPDGKWIAYVTWSDTAGGELWRIPSIGGQPEQLTHIPGEYEHPAWSPDGAYIGVIKGLPKLGGRDDPGKGQLEIIPLDGSPLKIIDDTIAQWNQLAFSSDGKRIIYAPKRIRYIVSNPLAPQLVSKTLDGQDLQVLAVGRTQEVQPYLQQILISPDKRYIVYSMAEDLYLVPVSQILAPTIIYDTAQRSTAIKFTRGVDPYWKNNGKTLGWTYGNMSFEVNPDKIIAQAQKKASNAEVGRGMTIAFKPDRAITIKVKTPRLFAHGIIALKNARIITMAGTKVIEHGTVLITDGRISAVGPAASISIPVDAKIMDLAGTTVLPGFVDMHLHMQVSTNIFPQQSWMFLANLAFGVTTARDPSASIDSYGYSELLESGVMTGPRLYSSGRPVIMADGIVAIDDLNDARAIVQKRKFFSRSIIKQYALPTRIQRQWLLMASKEAGLNMTNEGDFESILQIAQLKDGSTGTEHNPDWSNAYKDLILVYAKSGTYLTPTLQARYGEDLVRHYSNYLYWHQPTPKMKRFLPDDRLKEITEPRLKDTLHAGFAYPSIVDAEIRHQGGHVLLGSHGNNEGVGVHNELWALQMGGLTNMEALQAATIMGAEGLGVQKDLGSIEVGKIADLIVLNKNPLDDIHNSREIRYVMKDGILYDGETLDEMWPQQRKCPEWRLRLTSSENLKTD